MLCLSTQHAHPWQTASFASTYTTRHILSPLVLTIQRIGQASPVYRRGRGGCGRGEGALVAARPCTPHLFSLFSWNCTTNFIVHGAPTEHGLFEMYWPLWLPVPALTWRVTEQ